MQRLYKIVNIPKISWRNSHDSEREVVTYLSIIDMFWKKYQLIGTRELAWINNVIFPTNGFISLSSIDLISYQWGR